MSRPLRFTVFFLTLFQAALAAAITGPRIAKRWVQLDSAEAIACVLGSSWSPPFNRWLFNGVVEVDILPLSHSDSRDLRYRFRDGEAHIIKNACYAHAGQELACDFAFEEWARFQPERFRFPLDLEVYDHRLREGRAAQTQVIRLLGVPYSCSVPYRDMLSRRSPPTG